MEPTDLETGVDPMDALIGALGDEPAAEATDEQVGEEERRQEPEQTEEAANEAEAAPVVEFDGKTLEIPKGTPPALVQAVQSMAADLKADYTKKTQEVAEIRKATEARSNAIQKQEELLSANVEKVAEFKSLQARIAQFEQLDWNALAESSPAEATKLHIAYQQLRNQAGQRYAEIQQAEKDRQQLSATAKEKAIELAKLELTKRIPKLDDKGRQSMLEAAQRMGATEAHMYDPVYLEALHKAAQWDRLQAQKPQALQKVADAPRVLKPGPAEQRRPNQAARERIRTGRGGISDLATYL